jgi:hypothetical protein
MMAFSFKIDPAGARVRVGRGLTLSLGNFQMARIDEAVELPVAVENIDSAQAWARDWVTHNLQEEAGQIQATFGTSKR